MCYSNLIIIYHYNKVNLFLSILNNVLIINSTRCNIQSDYYFILVSNSINHIIFMISLLVYNNYPINNNHSYQQIISSNWYKYLFQTSCGPTCWCINHPLSVGILTSKITKLCTSYDKFMLTHGGVLSWHQNQPLSTN